jgi:hypothetical protein
MEAGEAEGRGRDVPALGASRVRKSAFRFVLESGVRRALRSAVDGAAAAVVVVVVDWVEEAVVGVEVDVRLALDAFERAGFAFGVFEADVVVVRERAWRLNEEAECRVIDDASDFASVTDLCFSYFAAAEFVFAGRVDRRGALGDASRCSFCSRRWPCL